MKTLYVSDVDGTITRRSSEPTEETKEIMQKLIADGVNFTIATGRSLGGAVLIQEDLGIKLPVICFNGSLVYDIRENKPINIVPIPQNVVEKLFDLFDKFLLPYRYCIYDHKTGQTITYRPDEMDFPISEKRNPKTGLLYEKIVVEEDIRRYYNSGDVLYVGYSCEKEKLLQLGDSVDEIEGISYTLHSDPYQDNYWYMDIYSSSSGKSVGAGFLKNMINADELVTFGDNFNDYCMIKGADRSYVVPEAHKSLKEIATGILDCNYDCVANFILNDNK